MKFTVLVLSILLVVGTTLAAGPGPGGCCKSKAAGCCDKGEQRGAGYGHGAGKGRGAGQGMRAGHGSDHDMIHALLDRHEAIQREVQEIEGGVETITVSDDPEVTEMIREHVRDMKRRVEAGHGMRWWDPTFAELFKHHEKIEMEIEDTEGGVLVREFSSDPDVTLLIRQHAIRGVSEFVAEGRDRAHKETPLPEGDGGGSEEPGTR